MNSTDINNMPLLKALNEYKKISPVRLHMPGHKAGRDIKKYFANVCQMDITELSFSDNLLKPDGIISRAESLCASAYSAEAVKFCTCGTTVSMLSLLHSVRQYGKSIIIERNSHKSVYSALKVSGIEPVIIDNKLGDDGLFRHISAQDIEKALEANPSLMGAVITSPDYYGFEADIAEISKALKKAGKLLLIDAAHGSHLPFCGSNPYAAADAYVCSAHKTLLSFTQASFAAFNNYKLYDGFLKSFGIFHTSSPSYPILASLDYSREFMQKQGAKRLLSLRASVDKYGGLIEKTGFKCVKNDDFTRFVIDVCEKNATGYEVAGYLEDSGIFCEFADGRRVVALLSAADSAVSLKKLYRALKRFRGGNAAEKRAAVQYPVLERVMPFLKASQAPKERVPLAEAAGRVAACEAGLYPPAYPVICSGDKITKEAIDFLLSGGEYTFGLDNGCIYVLK